MSDLNNVTLTGNLTRDPEYRVTENGGKVLNFGIAVNDSRKNKQTGEWEDYPNFFNCTVFGARAEGLSKVLAKGMRVAIDGKLHWHGWETETGEKRSAVSIDVHDLVFMSRRDKQAQQDVPVAAVPVPSLAPSVPTPQMDVYDEDIPF